MLPLSEVLCEMTGRADQNCPDGFCSPVPLWLKYRSNIQPISSSCLFLMFARPVLLFAM